MYTRHHIIVLFITLTSFLFSGQFIFSQEQDEQKPVLTEDQWRELSTPLEMNARTKRKRWMEYSNFLFDSRTFMGWTIQQSGPYGGGRFTIEDGAICSDPKHPGLIRTTGQFSDFTLEFEMSSEGPTDAFLLLRTSPSPKNLSTSCYAVVLTSTQEGQGRAMCSVLGRRAAPYSLQVDNTREDQDGLRWKRFSIFASRKNVKISSGTNANDVFAEESVRRGHIGFLVTRGKARFRNITWGVTNTNPFFGLSTNPELQTWKKLEAAPEFSAKMLQRNYTLTGGPGTVETDGLYKNFVLYAEFKTQNPDSKAGLFFRCIPEQPGGGYECIFYNNPFNANRTLFDHYFTGSLFGLQRARNVGAVNDEWNSLTINAVDNHFQIWVNGIQTVEWTDRRPESDPKIPDPRKGLRLQPGTIQLQGNDIGTNIAFRTFSVGHIPQRWISKIDDLHEREEDMQRGLYR